MMITVLVYATQNLQMLVQPVEIFFTFILAVCDHQRPLHVSKEPGRNTMNRQSKSNSVCLTAL